MARQADRRKTAYRKKLQNRTSMTLIIMIVAVLLLVVGVKGYGLTKERERLQAEYQANQKILEEQDAEEMEIEEYKKYMQTPQYYEDMAKEKLGMVYENEIIFVPED